ncbi:chaperone modulator CbpM [Snodgrassella sp. CFCC 13594]|uniref:chaperone modulator CbpM n=1 Tax=Snodgrassella sp. CFCC 13594 TaxID=1775559 RepID=UPI000830085A|nr:chaperone modulator CbpM [Snodgrassella sp. CFCC 13594]
MSQYDQDVELSFNELVRACGDQSDWVLSLIQENVITISGEPHQAHYSGYHLAQVRRAYRIHRDFNASASATALILELLDELEELRRRA